MITITFEDDRVETIMIGVTGSYYVDEGIATQTDNGTAFVMFGATDSTATVLELVSANNLPTISFMMTEDSSLVKVNANGTPAIKNPDHRLKIKK